MLIIGLKTYEDGVTGFYRSSGADEDAFRSLLVGLLTYPDELEVRADGTCVPAVCDVLSILSRIRGRRMKEGVFFAPEVLKAVEIFRETATRVLNGDILPELEEPSPGAFRAVWRLRGTTTPFTAWLADGLARFAGTTVLESEPQKYDSPDDAWLGALRNATGRIKWENPEDLRDLRERLAVWRAPCLVPAAERRALVFHLEAPSGIAGDWKMHLAASPVTRAGLTALGQAVRVFPPLSAMKRGCVILSHVQAENFIHAGGAALRAAGYGVEIPEGIVGEHLSLDAELSPLVKESEAMLPSQEPVVEAQMTFRVDGEDVGIEELEFLLDQGTALVYFRDRWIEVERAELIAALKLMRAHAKKRLSLAEAASYAFGFARVGGFRVNPAAAHGWLRGLLGRMKGEKAFRILPVPKGFKGTLRDYQRRGFSWLAFLTSMGFGPCLADDMGLGKTIQAIAFILHQRATSRNAWRRNVAPAPVLVVAPVTVTPNWIREFARFAPGLKVLHHQGHQRMLDWTFVTQVRHVDVVVTSYSLVLHDFRAFSRATFSTLILDEAQMVKNPDTKIARAVRTLGIPCKIALTGTPLENGPQDLWSLEAFLNPGLLGERHDFLKTYVRPMRLGGGCGETAHLRHIVEPFLLRRLKSDPAIAAELGTKRETREYCPLTAEQRQRYEDACLDYRTDATAEGALSSSRNGRILALLTALKQICDGANKEARLIALLEDIFAAGESALVFTQYAEVGKRLRAHLAEHFGREYPFLHGKLSLKEREREIAAFCEDDDPSAFILSLKAGGFGLNLVKATHVIHFDRWWNPAVENQATDRAYRIGQRSDVFVHLFISPGTLEDRIDKLLEEKRLLADDVVGSGEGFLLKMSDAELEKVVAIS